MKRRLFTFALAALTIGLLGSCSKINERIDGLDNRVGNIENEKIASIENQIAAINASIADLGTIRKDITDLQAAVGAKGEDIAELKAADEALGKRIDELQTYVDTELAKYATTEWANATFATLEQLKTTNTELGALKETVGKLGETFDGKLADLKTELTNAINTAVSNLETRISTLEARVSALEQMIQSVSITPAYSDGSVEAVDGILTLKCIVSPAEAIIGMESLKDSLLIYADSVKVKTKATTPAYMTIEVSEASVLDAAQGAITLKASISNYLPKGEGKALTVAVNVKNGISDFTTEFVPVYATKTTFKAVYDTNGGANTLTFYYDAVDHKGDNSNITVYDNLPTAATNPNAWGYNSIRGSVKSVVIDSSVAGYDALTSTAYMFQNMTSATDISGAEYLDVSNVTDMSLMFQYFGGGPDSNPTTINVVPDVSNWNTGNVTNMNQMFLGYGYKSETLNTVPDVSNWNTGNVTNMYQMFNGYGYTSSNISCVLDLSGWDLSKITETKGDDVFNFTPKTFNVTIPAKTGEKSNEGGKWYYGNEGKSIEPPTGKTFTILPAGALKGEFSVSATKKVYFSKGNLVATIDASGAPTAWKFAANQYDYLGEGGANKTIGATAGDVDFFGWSTSTNGGTSTTDNYGIKTSTTNSDYSGDFYDWGKAVGDGNTWRTLSKDEWTYLFNNHSKKWVTVNDVNGYVIAPDGFEGTLSDSYADDAALAANNLVFLPAAGFRKGSDVSYVGGRCLYWSSSACGEISAYFVFFTSSNVSTGNYDDRFRGFSVRLITEVPAAGDPGNGTEQYDPQVW